jgi:hypothetical protein
VGLCVFVAPELIVGAVIIAGVVVVAVAIQEEWDAYERRASRERARPEAQTRPPNKQEPSASRKPNPKHQPDLKGSPESFIPPNPTPEEQEEWRSRCLDYYVRCSEFVKGDKQWRVFGSASVNLAGCSASVQVGGQQKRTGSPAQEVTDGEAHARRLVEERR